MREVAGTCVPKSARQFVTIFAIRTLVVEDDNISKDRGDVVVQESDELGPGVVRAKAAGPVRDEVRVAVGGIGIVERGEGVGDLP